MKISMAFRHIALNMRLILIVIIILSIAKYIKNETELKYNVSNDTYFKPLQYDVKVRFDIYRNVFFGKCNISIEIHRPTKNITIRSSRIFGIIKIDLINNDNDRTPRKHPITVNIQKFSFINETDIYLEFTQSSSVDFLSPGRYILKIIYSSTILDNGDPFEFYNTDKEKILDNKSIKILRARELFPCWDEPVFKSTFNISIYHHKNYTFLSNMRIQRTVEMIKNMQWTHFDELRLLSAQHLTFVIINTFTPIKIHVSTTNVTLWCRNEIIDNVRFAAEMAQVVLYSLTQKSTKIVPNIQYIAIRDFQHSNEEIWGFILLREKDIFYNKTLDHIARKMEVINYIAHQTISHWYYDVFLWSKEGFITFLTAHILNQIPPNYRTMDLFVVQMQQESLRFNTLPSMDFLPLFFHYIKSPIVWRMLYHLVTDDVFWTSINLYMDQYNQSNVLQTDKLWNIMQINLNNSNNPHNLHIKDIINTWITQKQYPTLYVERNYSNIVTTVWLHDFEFNDNTEYSTLVTYVTKTKHYNYFWLDRQKPRWSFNETFDKHDWIIVNYQQIGYYRINYNIENWENLAYYLYYENVTGIHVLNRAQIIDDAFYFFTQRQLSYKMFWNITSFLFKDTDYVAWYPMIKAVEYITCIWPVQNTVAVKLKINEMFYGLLQNIDYHEYFYENEFTKYLREEAVKWACVLGEPKCRLMATNKLKKDLQSSVQETSLKWKEWIYCKGLMAADNKIWQSVKEKWIKTNDNTLLEYLTCSTDPEINTSYLRLMQYEFNYEIKPIKKIFVNIIFLIVAKHAKNDIVFQSILEKLDRLIQFGSKMQVDHIAIIIVIITHDTSIDHFKKINEFVKNNLTMSDKRLVDAVEQKIKKRIKEYQKQMRNYGSLGIF